MRRRRRSERGGLTVLTALITVSSLLMVGLVLDLGSEQSVRSLTVTLGGSGYAFDVYAAPEGARGPTDITGLKRIGRAQDAGGRTQVEVDPVTTRYVVVWLTALAASPDGGFRGSVQEVVVRS